MSDVRWEEVRRGASYRAAIDGYFVGQVAHVRGPGGRDDGWMAWMRGDDDALVDGCPSAEAAMAAVEIELKRRS